MDEPGHTPEPMNADYIAFQQECRKRTAAYIAVVANRGHNVAPVLKLVAAHMAQAGDGEVCQAHWEPADMTGLPQDIRRILISTAGAVCVVGNWAPQDILAMGQADGAVVPAALTARMMMPWQIGVADKATAERLLSTLEPAELNWLVCVISNALVGMGCTPQMVQEMHPQWTMGAP